MRDICPGSYPIRCPNSVSVHPAARRAGHQPGPDQEGLGHHLDRLGFLAHGHREGRQSHRPAAELADQGAKYRVIKPVEAAFVDLVQLPRGSGDIPGDHPVPANFGEISDPAQQPVCDAGGAAGPAGDLIRSIVLEGNAQ